MSCVLIYDVVDVNKNVVISSFKMLSYLYTQVNPGVRLIFKFMVGILSQIPTL